MDPVLFEVGAALRCTSELSPEVDRALKKCCEHANPELAKRRAMGRSQFGVPRQLRLWRESGGRLELPRGCAARVREALGAFGLRPVWRDRRVSVPVQWPEYAGPPPRIYQGRGSAAIIKWEQGIVRAPTGSGKSTLFLSTLPEIGQRACVVVRNSKLAKQWRSNACDTFGWSEREIGMVGDGRHTVGEHLTIAMQQTLWSTSFDLEAFAARFGVMCLDEVQGAAARTVSGTCAAFPSKFRIGLSADESRKDRLECVTYDVFGGVICEITRDDVRRTGHDVPVVVRLVPTGVDCRWYREAPAAERDFGRLVEELVSDEGRNALLCDVLSRAEHPCLVFTHRREHARELVMRGLPARGVPSGLMLGGKDDSGSFDETQAMLQRGEGVGVGTFQSIGVGIDVPRVMSGCVSTPLGKNPQFFNQVRGRVCRPWPGKRTGFLYYLWDEAIFPDLPKHVASWNEGLVQVLGPSGDWVPWQR